MKTAALVLSTFNDVFLIEFKLGSLMYNWYSPYYLFYNSSINVNTKKNIKNLDFLLLKICKFQYTN